MDALELDRDRIEPPGAAGEGDGPPVGAEGQIVHEVAGALGGEQPIRDLLPAHQVGDVEDPIVGPRHDVGHGQRH